MQFGHSLEKRQEQNLSQFQVQYFSILKMDCQELDSYMTQCYMENPMLDMSPVYPVVRSDEQRGNLSDSLETLKAPPMHHRYALFMEQLNLLDYSEAELQLMLKMIDSLNENGYYTLSVKETSTLFRVPERLVQKCLTVLQGLEPAGIFAYDLQDCLIIQLRRIGKLNDELESLLREHPDCFYLSASKTAAEEHGLPASRMKEYRKLISSLNPRPFYKPDCRNNHAVKPDIICYYREKKWEFLIEEENHFSLNDHYLSLVESCSKDDRDYLNRHLIDAEQLLSAVALRARTLTDLADFLSRKQSSTLLYGVPPKPLTMTEAAADIGVSESTVSRACKGKYLEAPAGAFCIRDLFPLTAADSSSYSDVQIKKRIQQIILNESKSEPLSDDALRMLLEKEQIIISRRTVAKYRKGLGIPDSYCRREDGKQQ